MVIPSPNSTLKVLRNVAQQMRSAAVLEKEKRATDRFSRVPPPPRDMQLSILKTIVVMLKERREKMQESGKKGRDLINILVDEHLPRLPWLTPNMVHHFITIYTNENMAPHVIQTKHQQVCLAPLILHSMVGQYRLTRHLKMSICHHLKKKVK
jgi:hypothetical protein